MSIGFQGNAFMDAFQKSQTASTRNSILQAQLEQFRQAQAIQQGMANAQQAALRRQNIFGFGRGQGQGQGQQPPQGAQPFAAGNPSAGSPIPPSPQPSAPMQPSVNANMPWNDYGVPGQGNGSNYGESGMGAFGLRPGEQQFAQAPGGGMPGGGMPTLLPQGGQQQGGMGGGGQQQLSPFAQLIQRLMQMRQQNGSPQQAQPGGGQQFGPASSYFGYGM